MAEVKLSLREQQILCCMLWGGDSDEPLEKFLRSPWREKLKSGQAGDIAATIATEGPKPTFEGEVTEIFWGRTLTDREGPDEIVQVVVAFEERCAHLVIDYPTRTGLRKGWLCELNVHPVEETPEVMQKVRDLYAENALDDILEKLPEGGLEHVVTLLLNRRQHDLSP